jgi:hypothetical protein
MIELVGSALIVILFSVITIVLYQDAKLVLLIKISIVIFRDLYVKIATLSGNFANAHLECHYIFTVIELDYVNLILAPLEHIESMKIVQHVQIVHKNVQPV